MRACRETDEAAPPIRVHGNTSFLPDGAAYWDAVHGQDVQVQAICSCEEPLIGKPRTPYRWTCRKCGGKVQQWTCSQRAGSYGVHSREEITAAEVIR